MLQIPTNAFILTITAAGANENAKFADTPCVGCVISADGANVGSVYYGGVTGGTADTAGIKLSAGQASPFMYIDNLNKLSYKIVTSGEKIQVLVFR